MMACVFSKPFVQKKCRLRFGFDMKEAGVSRLDFCVMTEPGSPEALGGGEGRTSEYQSRSQFSLDVDKRCHAKLG